MRVLVTGGAGFVGSHIVDRLVRHGDEVLVVDDLSTGKTANLPPEVVLKEMDIADPSLVRVASSFRPDLEIRQSEVVQVKPPIGEGAEPLAAATPRSSGDPISPVISEEEITKLVDARVEAMLKEKEKEQQGGDGRERKMQATDLAKELDLDPATLDRVSGIADNTKTEMFQMLSTPRTDGGSFIDDLRLAMESEDRSQVGPVFIKLFTDRIPGTEVTYIAGINEIRGRGHESLKGVMGDVTYEQYAGMKIHPDHILTTYDPFSEFAELDQDNKKE